MYEPYFYLGQLYEYGYGVDRDYTTSLRYYLKAAQMGHGKSYSKCGDFIYSGKGCGKKDKSEAFKYY
jgi:TPR repeat protein